MNKLINQNLLLKKTKYINNIYNKVKLNLSDIITNIIFQYEIVYFEEKRIFKYNITPNIYLNCNK